MNTVDGCLVSNGTDTFLEALTLGSSGFVDTLVGREASHTIP